LDFGRCDEQRASPEYQAILMALRGGRREVEERPVADLTVINSVVLDHLRAVARGLRNQEGYKSQFVEVTKPFRPQMGNDPEGVVDRLWHESFVEPKAVTRPPAVGDEVRPRVWAAKDLAPARPKKWLARQRIPWGQMTIMVGDEGIGKSLFWVWVVAAITTGKPLPEFGIPTRDARHVRLIITEDDWATDVRPRLELAGVDLDYVSLVAAQNDGTGTPVFPSDDMSLLYEDPVPALVVVDALADTVAPEINMSNAVSARILLSQWTEYATRTGAAVLILSHTNRMTDAAQARERYGISAELRKKARMTLFAQLDDDGMLLIGPEKSNGSSPIQASRFKVEPIQVRPPTDDDDGTVARVVYAGDSTKTARQKAEEKKPEFADWLRDLLSAGPLPSAEVLEAAKRDGVSAYQLTRAKEYLLVESFKAKEFQGQWQMRLPAGGAP